MKLIEELKTEKIVFNGKIMTVKKDEVTLPNGETSFREVVLHNGGSAVLLSVDNKILFVKQFRYSVGGELLELPAGKLEKGENPQDTAIRELEEEGGYKVEKVKLLSAFYPTPGYSSEKIYVYEGINPVKTNMHLDENEFLSHVWIDEDEVLQYILDGKIVDAKTIIGVQTYLLGKMKK